MHQVTGFCEGNDTVQRECTQCLLTKRVGHIVHSFVSWIPKHLAVVGKILKCREHDSDPWDHDWTVAAAYNTEWRDVQVGEGIIY
jgi:hypothetical protein